MSSQSSVASQVSESAAQLVAPPVTSAMSASVSASSASQATTPVTVTNGSNQLLADATLAKLQLYHWSKMSFCNLAMMGKRPVMMGPHRMNKAHRIRWAC